MADYLSKTANLSILEHGAYTLLLDYSYLGDGRLPGDLDEICRVVRAVTPTERQAVGKILDRFFTQDTDCYTNPRVLKEVDKAKPAMEAARTNGVKGGRPKNNPVGFVDDAQQVLEAKASQPPTPNHQPLTPQPQTKGKNTVALIALPEWIDPALWGKYVEKCRPKKARDPEMLQGCIEDLAKWRGQGMDPNEIIARSFKSGWRGLFPPDRGKGAKLSVAEINRLAGEEAQRRFEAEHGQT